MIYAHSNLWTITLDDVHTALQHVHLVSFNISFNKANMLIFKKFIQCVNGDGLFIIDAWDIKHTRSKEVVCPAPPPDKRHGN